MRRVLAHSLLAVGLMLTASTQGRAAEHEAEASHEQPSIWWKWFNFSLLAAGLGYLAVSQGGPYFRKRGEEISKLIRAAEQIRTEAEAEAAAIDKKIAGLGAEVAAVRERVRQEFEALSVRADAEAEAAGLKMQQTAEAEIETLTKHARRKLRAAASEKALALAREKVRARMNPEVEARLFDRFVGDLKRPGGVA
jgi:F0F1-type ATP synthase membrane subunit b/b'